MHAEFSIEKCNFFFQIFQKRPCYTRNAIQFRKKKKKKKEEQSSHVKRKFLGRELGERLDQQRQQNRIIQAWKRCLNFPLRGLTDR